MTQRNPMNERYTEEHGGSTRKSAASAKPKAKAAASVTVKTTAKTPREKKAEAKAARKRANEEQRALDRKYYTPDTKRYKVLRRAWWICLVGAVLCTILSWFSREIEPMWISMVGLFGAYGLIIAAFYIDFSKIKKERQAYQARMIALEEKQKKAERAAARAERQQGGAGKVKGSGKNASRNPKAQAKAAAVKAAAEATEKTDAKA